MILVTGITGQLGFDVIRELKKRNIECIGVSSKELDITDEIAVNEYILKLNPKSIIHCAAYTSVEKAEEEKEKCIDVNVKGTENIVKVCKKINATLMYISTDYVYNGLGNKPFEVNDNINPICVYGKSKYEGELKVKEYLSKYFIVRISWVFGVNGNNFVKTMLRLGKKQKNIKVVCDQIGSPTYTADLAVLLSDMIKSDKYGTYNASNEGYCSWAQFAEAIMKSSQLDCEIIPIKSSEYPTKVSRPLNSRMSKSKLTQMGFNRLPEWKKSLKDYLNELNGEI